MTRERRGFALLAVLIMILVATAVVGAFQLRVIGDSTRARYSLVRRSAFLACEHELWGWSLWQAAPDIPVGAWMTTSTSLHGATVVLTLSRMSDTIVWL